MAIAIANAVVVKIKIFMIARGLFDVLARGQREEEA